MAHQNEQIKMKITGSPELDGTHEAVVYTSYSRVFELFGGQDNPNCFIKINLEDRTCGCILNRIQYSDKNCICIDRCKMKVLNTKDGEEAYFCRTVISPVASITLSTSYEMQEHDKTKLFNKPLVSGEKTLLFTLSGQARIIRVEKMDSDIGIINQGTKVIIKKVNDVNGIPVSYKDIGGLEHEIRQIRESVEWPLRYAEQFEYMGVPHPKGVLLYGPPGTGKTLIAKALASEVGARIFTVNGPEVYGKWYGESEARLRSIFEQAQANAPAIIMIDELDALAPSRKGEGEVERRVVATLLTLMDGIRSLRGVIVIGTTNRINSIDPALRREGRFSIEINIGNPDTEGRKRILEIHTRKMPLSEDIDLNALATRTVGFVGADIVTLCREAAFCAIRDSLENIESETALLGHQKIRQSHFLDALKNIRPSALREFFVEIPDTSWEDVGGLEDIKNLLIENITYAIIHPDAYHKAGVRPARGILLYGLPGTGKTLLAKAAARQSGANFIAIRSPEIRSKWFGESEERLREIFSKAREVSPCIIFFDEIDALAPSRDGNQNSDSIVNQLLAEIDGIQSSDGVIVIGATNQHKLLDPALLRPGRFDYQIEVPMPDWNARKTILCIHLKGKPLAPDVNYETLEDFTKDFSGSEISEMCRQAGMLALRRANFEVNGIEITQKDLLEAGENVRKTTEDLKHKPFGFAIRK